MTKSFYSRKAAELSIDLNAKIRQRDKLNLEIAQLQQKLKAFLVLATSDDKAAGMLEMVRNATRSPIGLTDAVRAILTTANEPVSAVDVRNKLIEAGFDLGEYANPLAFIATILKRLTDNGQVKLAGRKGRSPRYEWVR